MCGAYSLELGVTHLALSQFVTYEKGGKMSEIARFYGFTVSMDNTFTGNPNIFIDYEEDNIREAVYGWIVKNCDYLMDEYHKASSYSGTYGD
jgi:hypothetical protein